jgi:nitrite reductase (NADH) small subunit
MTAHVTAEDTTVAAPPGTRSGQEGDAGWAAVCHFDDLVPERGAAALLGERQVALFRTFDGMVFALDNRDPFTGACVLSRGIVGTRGDVPTVASPLHKQVFDLRTGSCLDDADVTVASHAVRVRDGMVEVRVAGTGVPGE